jgi:hypothetical protein
MTTSRRVVIGTLATRGLPESQRLTRALVDLGARGLRPHCSDVETHSYWLSEDAHERKRAVRWCAGCPVLVPCREAAESQGERWGVWGGLDFTRRPGKKQPPDPPDAQQPAA